MVDLKPCPFCGGTPEILIDEIAEGERKYLVKCEDCDGMIERWFDNAGDSVTAWNRRAHEKPRTAP